MYISVTDISIYCLSPLKHVYNAPAGHRNALIITSREYLHNSPFCLNKGQATKPPRSTYPMPIVYMLALPNKARLKYSLSVIFATPFFNINMVRLTTIYLEVSDKQFISNINGILSITSFWTD